MKPPNDLSDEYLEKELRVILNSTTDPYFGYSAKCIPALLAWAKMLIERARKSNV